MTASQCCSIASHKDAAAIDEALRSGGGVRTLAARFELSKSALGRHREHLGLKGAPPPATQTPAVSPKQETAVAKGKPHLGTTGGTASQGVPRVPSENEDADKTWLGDAPTGREHRVRACMHLMVNGRWETGVTGPELAETWGCSPRSLELYAAEASRRVRAAGEAGWVKERLCVALDEALEDARGRPRDVAIVADSYAPIAGVIKPPAPTVNLIVEGQSKDLEVNALTMLTERLLAGMVLLPGGREMAARIVAGEALEAPALLAHGEAVVESG